MGHASLCSWPQVVSKGIPPLKDALITEPEDVGHALDPSLRIAAHSPSIIASFSKGGLLYNRVRDSFFTSAMSGHL